MTAIHIAAGLLALLSGAFALAAAKGGGLHRKSGIAFVGAIAVMATGGALMAAMKPDPLSVLAGVLTLYLAATALLTVRRRSRASRSIEFAAMLVALAVGIAGIVLGVNVPHGAPGTTGRYPPAPYFLFAAVAILAALLDLRMFLASGIRGKPRIARHLWRMCFALFIATASFFLGQAKVFPEPMRNLLLLAIPVMLVLVVMLYWLARVLVVAGTRPLEPGKPAGLP